jgi:hypothetical protein
MFRETELFESTGLTPLDFCLSRWIKSEVHKTEIDTPDALLARILYVVPA